MTKTKIGFFEITELGDRNNKHPLINKLIVFNPKGGSDYTLEKKLEYGYFGILRAVDRKNNNADVTNIYIDNNKIEICDEQVDLRMIKSISKDEENFLKENFTKQLDFFKLFYFKLI
jgi:uncharacterized protein YlbG (UPF0298 family)